MKTGVLIRTICKLRLKQIVCQIISRLYHRSYHNYSLYSYTGRLITFQPFIQKNTCCKDNVLCFLNICDKFHDWNDTRHGMLWAYNVNYMDWLLQADLNFEEGARWIDLFIEDIDGNKIGLDPYPTALRGVNWIKFISLNINNIEASRLQIWNNALYSQYRLLERSLEFRLLGNHLLEDAYSLFIAAIYFSNSSFYDKATKLLKAQLKEQILADGAHYEQSPMYHCILLDRLLDCYNVSINNYIFKDQLIFNEFLAGFAVMMLGHLECIIYKDGTIPLLNDSAYDIAPSPDTIFDYAKRLNLSWIKRPMKDCGYRKMSIPNLEAIVDVGGMTASYQPGHSHADTFNYEIRLNGIPFIIDTGISTYDKNSRRQYERSTPAHNTVSIGGRDSSEVWGGFRVGRRANVTILEDGPYRVVASHDGFGDKCTHLRTFDISDGNMAIMDELVGRIRTGVSYIHFAPDVSIVYYDNNIIKTDRAEISIKGSDNVNILDGQASTTYNSLCNIKIAAIEFSSNLTYIVVFK